MRFGNFGKPMKVLKKKKKHHGMAVFTANESTIKQQTEVPAAITMAATNWRTCGSAARRQAAGCRQTRTASCRGGYSDWQSSQVKTTRSELPAQSPDSRHRPAHPVQEMLRYRRRQVHGSHAPEILPSRAGVTVRLLRRWRGRPAVVLIDL